jgi:hypothetical protein
VRTWLRSLRLATQADRLHDRGMSHVCRALLGAVLAGLCLAPRPSLAITDGLAQSLVPGYGPSTRLGNIALVEASQSDLERWYAVELSRSSGMDSPPDEQVNATSAVAAQFLAALVPSGRSLAYEE